MPRPTNSDLPQPPKGPLRTAFDFLSGFGLATILLLILGLLTWFATLEQIDHGLYPTLRKYFDWREWYVLPDFSWLDWWPKIGGNPLTFPLPGGYWTCALLLVNMTLGGIIRIRKGWKSVGNLIAHFGIIFMLIAGGVAHHYSERGNMAVGEGAESNVAEDYFEYVVEVAEIVDGKPDKVLVIRGDRIEGLTDGASRVFRFPDLPFDVEVAGYLENCVPVSVNERAPAGERVVDDFYLMEKPGEKNAEANTAGCYARVLERDGSKGDPFILAGASFHPFTLKHGDRVFTVDMRKRLWAMPFTVRLDEFDARFHPGTMKPAKFISHITRIEDGHEAPVVIQMNEPMRYEGLTFFQASYGPPGAMPGQKMYSVFEIVRNPADKWPEYSLYIVSFGMLVTFLTKLGGFVVTSTRKRSNHA